MGLAASDVDDDLDFVQRGEGLGACLRAIRKTDTGLRVGRQVITEVFFLNETSAVVRWTVELHGGPHSISTSRRGPAAQPEGADPAAGGAPVGRRGLSTAVTASQPTLWLLTGTHEDLIAYCDQPRSHKQEMNHDDDEAQILE
jgi:hypothetical protein